MRKCVFCKTIYKKGSKTSFHRFPSELTVRNMWLENMKALNWTPRETDSLCSKHFEAKCFITHNTRTALKSGTVPTLFQGLFEIPDQNYNEELKKEADDNSCSDEKMEEEELQPADFTYPYKYVPDLNFNEELEKATDDKFYGVEKIEEEESHPADFTYPYKYATCNSSTSQSMGASPCSSKCQSSKRRGVNRMLSENMDSSTSDLRKSIKSEHEPKKTRIQHSVAHDHQYESSPRSSKLCLHRTKRSLQLSNARVKTLTQHVKRLKIKVTHLKTVINHLRKQNKASEE